MAPIIPDPTKIKSFRTVAGFETWLGANHARETELWLRIYKKDSRVPTVTHAQALDVALCWGWIDGIRKAFDDRSFLQRFTPRKARSVWSQINRDNIARLTAAGRMTPHGRRQVNAAKADGRWDAAYAPIRNATEATIPADLRASIEENPRARKTFRTLGRLNLFALAFRTNNMKTPAGRAKKIAALVAMLARGETIAVVLTALGVALLSPPLMLAQGPRPDAATIARAVDSLAARAVAEGLAPALGVAVTMDGRTIYMKSHGMADAAASLPADDRTLWYVASTSKSFTGVAVSLLAHQGALRFEAPITRLLPQVQWNPAVRAESLTLAHFLSHTHRMNDNAVVSSAAFTGAIPEARWPTLIALAQPNPTDDLVYSNFGYNVAAMVIDVIRPEGWRRYLEQHVLLPVGMRETYARVSGLDKRIAKPHRFRGDGRYVTEPFFKTDATMNSAGGHLATLHDLARWTIVQTDSGMIDGRRVFPAQAVAFSHRLIAKQTREQAKRFAFFDREGWGAGWDIGAYEGERMVSRFGSYHTTRSHLSFLPGRRIGAVVMSTGGLSALTDIVAAFAYDLEAGRPDARERAEGRLAELRTRFAASRKTIATQDSSRAARQLLPLGRPLADFVGVYEEPSFGTVAFTIQDGRLRYRWGALYGPAEIFDAERGQLRIEITGSGTVVTFAFVGDGPARSLDLQGVKFLRARGASLSQPQSLFNGKDLSGWHVDVPAADSNARLRNPFVVRNGVLVSLGEPRGHLLTDSSYRDYRLEIEYRFTAAPGNAGVLVQASTPRALYGMFPRSIEVQMEHGNAGDFWCILEDIHVPDMERRRGPPAQWGTTEGKARRIRNLTDHSEKPVGEWNTMVIETVGRSIRVWVNGDLVNGGSDATADRGRIALQSEGSEVEFRNLSLTPIRKLTITR